MTDFYLLTKPDCPLCDEALARLHAAQPASPIRLHIVDITNEISLQEEYGWLIPVLIRQFDDAELRWPFPDALEDFLNP